VRTVCEPANSLEGHMLQDLLQQRGIHARLEGAGLQGAIGELPTIGLVRLLVEDEDFAAARAVMDEWEKTAVPEPIQNATKGPPGAWLGAVIGLVIGIGATYIYFRVPTQVDGIDHNGDGVLDERWNYSPGGTQISTEFDRNFDRLIDSRWHFDRLGHVESAESDDDFNGSFETTAKSRDGQVDVSAADTDEDSIADLRYLYRHGVLFRAEYTRKDSVSPLRIEAYRLGKLVSAEVDTDHDGTLDRRYFYDDIGEIATVEEIEASQ
jgi:Putative prokaryotic signal transducing protein